MPRTSTELLRVKTEPRVRHIVVLHPFERIEPEPNGSGGIRVRILEPGGDHKYVDLIWGRNTEIEVLFVTEPRTKVCR